MKKNMKGISLIVLIVTIIVMIIIAGAIIISLTQTNVIDQAENATSEYNLKVEKEKIQLALNEWLLEERTSTNPKTFKAFMTEALPDVTISGTDEGPITIKIKDTGNEYKVTKDGEITIKKAVTATPLELYLFGEDMQGKDLEDLLSASEESMLGIDFIDDDTTEINERDVLELVGGIEVEIITETETEIAYTVYYIVRDTRDTNNTILYYVGVEGYENYETGEYYEKTSPELGITKTVESSEFNVTDVGKTVSYDNKLWTIIYDDETNGLQMVCNEGMLYNGDKFTLGVNTTSITDWDTLLTDADLDNSGDLTDFEKAAYSYNNAIDILNAACESVVTTNINILDVRSLGSNPVNKELDTEIYYTSELLATLPESNETYPAGFANGKLKSPLDVNEDDSRLMDLYYLGMYEMLYEGWVVSRYIVEDEGKGINFRLGSEFLGDRDIIEIYSARASMYNSNNLLSPVVKLNPDVEFSGAGTTDSPYTF